MKHIHILILSSLISIWGNAIHAQETINKDSLAADFSFLIKQLEATHPDPYSGFGGKVFFHKQAFCFQNDLILNDYTIKEFTEKVSEFLANLQDGHTYLSTPNHSEDTNKAGIFIVGGKVIADGIILKGVPPESKDFLGSRILGINGIPMDSLLHIASTSNACENLYGQYNWVNEQLNQSDFILKLFPTLQDSLPIQIETPDGKRQNISIPLVDRDKWRDYPVASLPAWEMIPGNNSYLSYKFLDENETIMFFKLSSIMARENFEVTIHNHWPSAYENLQWFYKQTLKKEMPADTALAIAGVPSYSETFFRMLQEMKKQKSQTLIIDLRQNGGGWTPITLPSLYQLYGDNYLLTDMGIAFHRLISPLYLEKTHHTLEEFNKDYNSNYQLGDYDFEKTEKDTSSIETQRKQFIQNCLSCLKPELEKQQGKPVYTPEKIYVITDDCTFSAAFHYAFYLWKMGATLVGIPTRQAPNTFMEQTSFQLPYTKLNGSISNSIQVFLPPKDPRTKIFWPDMIPSYNDYKKYQFDKHTEVRYLLDKMNQ